MERVKSVFSISKSFYKIIVASGVYADLTGPQGEEIAARLQERVGITMGLNRAGKPRAASRRLRPGADGSEDYMAS